MMAIDMMLDCTSTTTISILNAGKGGGPVRAVLLLLLLAGLVGVVPEGARAQFPRQALFDTQEKPVSVDVVDIDGDGDLDAVAAFRTTPGVAWFEHDGDGNFTKHVVSTPSTHNAQDIQVADVDGDGHADLIVDGDLWLENDGNEMFTEHSITSGVNSSSNTQVADVDGDGDVDLIAGTSNSDLPLEWHENDGTGAFTSHAITTGIANVRDLVANDVDEDGDVDFIAASENAGTMWFENDGNGSFTRHGIGVSTSTSSLDVADVDADGDLDIVGGGGNAPVIWYENDGNENFFERELPLTVDGTVDAGDVLDVAAADVDNDGFLDIATTERGADQVVWYLNDGTPVDGGWTQKIVSRTTQPPSEIQAADVESDGDVDLLAASGRTGADRVQWYRNDGSDSFSTRVLSAGPSDARDAHATDLNGDGHTDFLTASQQGNRVSWYKNDGSNDFTAHVITLASQDEFSSGLAVTAADLDGDEDQDVVWANRYGGKLAWNENLGNGDFASTKVISTTVRFAVDVHSADLDKDGDQDLVVAAPGYDCGAYCEGATVWIENQGGGNFSSPRAIKLDTEGSTNPVSVQTADLSGNDSLDVVAALSGEDRVAWYENQDGSFSGKRYLTNESPEGNLRDVYATDLNGNGTPDVAFISEVVGWYENQGDETFATADTISGGKQAIGPEAIYAKDVTGNGNPDLFAGGDKLFWHENRGGGRFGPRQDLPTPRRNTKGLHVAPLDGSGGADVIAAHRNGVSWFANRIQSLAVAGIEPESGAPGTPIRVYGTGFDPTASNNDVTIGGATATVDSAQKTVIYARVPSGVSGPAQVSVSSGGATVSAAGAFTVTTGGGTAFTPVNSGLAGTVSDWGDFDNDGDQDPLTNGRNGPTIYENQGNGHFVPLNAGLDAGRADVWGDVDNDGDLDAIGTGVVYLNQGGGTFTARQTGLDLNAEIDDVGDIDGDGDLDFVLAGSSRPKIYLNDGEGRFSEIGDGAFLDFTSESRDIDIGDYDGDGDLDLVAGGSRDTYIYKNQGGGRFTTVTPGLPGKFDTILPDVPDGMVAWGDYDTDGDLDVAVAGDSAFTNTPITHVYENKPDTLVRAARLEGVTSGTLRWGDVNGDGAPDLLVSGRSSIGDTTIVYRNDTGSGSSTGSGGFTGVGSAETRIPGDAARPLWADYDADGDLDVVAGSRLFRNGPSAFSLPAPPTGAVAGPTGSGVTVDWAAPSSGADRYHVFRSTAPIDSVQGLAQLTPVATTTATEYADSSAQTGTTYYYRVTSLDTEGHESGFSGEAQATPAGQLTVPVTVRTNGGGARQLTLGLDPAATSGRDTALGETEQPPLPPSDVFDARLIDDDISASGFGEGLALDLRTGGAEFRGRKTHEIRYQTGANASSVTIDVDLPYGVIGTLEDVSTGGGTVRDTLQGNDATTISDLSLQKLTLELSYRVPAASQTKTVSADGGVAFPDPGAELDFSGTTGTGEITVDRFGFGPVGTSGISEGSVLESRFVVESVGNLTFDTTQVRLAASALPPLADPEAVTLYKRPEAGSGSFDALPTSYDDNGTPDSFSDDTLSAPVTSFSEIALATTADVSPPDVPSGLRAEAAPDSVSLGWTASDSSDVKEYRVYRDTASIDSTAGPSALTPLATTNGNATTFVDRGVERRATYYYRVTAADTAGNESGFSNEAQATPADRTAPDVPTSLSAEAPGDSVDLAWEASDSTDVGSYRIYRSKAPIDSSAGPSALTALDTTGASATAFVDKEVQLASTYYYRVTAVDTASNESGFSGEVTVTPGDQTPPDVPTALAATVDADTVDLGWAASDSADVAEYRVYRDTAPIDSTAGPEALTAFDTTGASTTSYADSTGQSGTTYYYRVTAVDTADNESSFSGEVWRTPGPAPTVPQGLSASATADTVDLGWEPVSASDLERYRVYRGTAPIDSAAGPSSFAAFDSTGAGTTAFADTTVQSGTTYYYRITAVDTSLNESAFSREAQATPGDTTGGGGGGVVAAADSFSTPEGQTLSVQAPGVLGNDRGDSLSASVVTDVSDGTLSLDADGAFSYTPDSTFTGTDKFVYEAADGDSTDQATATIEVTSDSTGGEDRVVAEADSFSSPKGEPLSVQAPGVLGNDSGDSLSAALVSGVSNGSLTLDGDGSFTYVPDSTFTGTDEFVYEAASGDSTDQATATIEVTGDSTGGGTTVVARPDSFSTPEGQTLSVAVPGVLGNDSGDSLSASLVSGVTSGSLTLDADGSFSYDPDASFSGTDEFNYQATDGDSTDQATVIIEVTSDSTGGGPTVVVRPDTFAAAAGQTLTVEAPGVLGDDSGSSLSASVVTDVSNGTLSLDADGSFSYTPDSSFTGIDEFDYEAASGDSTDQATATIEVQEPVASASESVDAANDAGSTVEFGETGTSVTFSSQTSGSGEVGVNRFEDPPTSTGGIAGNASEYRVEVSLSGDLSVGDGTEIRFDESKLDGASNPSAVTIYTRETPGSGSFQEVSTTYDEAAGELVATVSGFSEFAFGSDTEPLFSYPNEVTASVSRSFGDASGPGDYRLVGLPGAPDRPLAEVIGGEAGDEWQSFWYDGSGFVRHDGSETFRLKKGRGFWLTARQDWSLEASIGSAPLSTETAAKIALNDGWTIVANPFGSDVSWSAVQEANGSGLSALWPFGGAFNDTSATFASAKGGQAYFVLNQKSSRDSLVIPYPKAATKTSKRTPSSKQAPSSERTASAKEQAPDQFLRLSARAEGTERPASTVRLGVTETPSQKERLIAPPGGLEAVSLRVVADAKGEGERKEGSNVESRNLMLQRKVESEEGAVFQLRLTSREAAPVRLRARNLAAFGDRSVALLRPAAGTSQDLRKKEALTVELGSRPLALKLAVGTESFVEEKRAEVLPQEVRLTSYPNPVREEGTLAYALPEQKKVTLRVYDVLGREVATLVREAREAGRHTASLETGQLASGVYFGRLRAGGQVRTVKITVVR